MHLFVNARGARTIFSLFLRRPETGRSFLGARRASSPGTTPSFHPARASGRLTSVKEVICVRADPAEFAILFFVQREPRGHGSTLFADVGRKEGGEGGRGGGG